MNADGSNPTRLTNNAASDIQSSWSPDGTRIAFASDREGMCEIHVMDTNGLNVNNLDLYGRSQTPPGRRTGPGLH